MKGVNLSGQTSYAARNKSFISRSTQALITRKISSSENGGCFLSNECAGAGPEMRVCILLVTISHICFRLSRAASLLEGCNNSPESRSIHVATCGFLDSDERE